MNNLKAIRQRKGIQREKLSRMTGIKTGTIKHWEDGSVALEKAAYISIMKVAKALEIEPDMLFGGDYMTMTRTQTIDEIKTVMAYLTESCGGYPIALDEAIRMLTEDGQKLEKIEEYTREPFSHPDDYDQGNWHKAQALANILTIFDHGLQ